MPPPQIRRAKQADADDFIVTIKVNDHESELRPREVDALLGLELRRTVGYTAMDVVRMLMDSRAPDVIAIAVWIGCRQAGDTTTTFAEIAEQIDYDAKIEVSVGKAIEDAEGEDPAADTGGSSPASPDATD